MSNSHLSKTILKLAGMIFGIVACTPVALTPTPTLMAQNPTGVSIISSPTAIAHTSPSPILLAPTITPTSIVVRATTSLSDDDQDSPWKGLTLTPLTATPTPTPLPTNTPDPLSPIAPQALYQEEEVLPLELVQDDKFGQYFVRRWCTSREIMSAWSHCLITIDAPGQTRLEIGPVHHVHELTGQDITGEGNPDVIFTIGPVIGTVFPSARVYDLGEVPRLVLDTQSNNCSTEFVDFDDNGSWEAIGCDSSFAYDYCPGITTWIVNVKVIYEYTLQEGYVPANLKFADQYAEDIVTYTQVAQEASPGSWGEFDSTTKCGVLGLVLSYLYSGQEEAGWAALKQYYTFPDLEEFKAEIEANINSSPLFVQANNE